MKRKISYLIFFLQLIFLFAGAQNESYNFSLEEAQSYAMQHSYILQNSSIDINKARKKIWETITTGLPQVSGSAAYNNFLNLPVSLIPGEFFGQPAGTYIPVKFGQDYSSDFGISISQTIFDGSYIIGIGSSKLYLEISRQSNEKAEIDIRNAVTQAYYLVLVGEENKKVMEKNLVNVRILVRETQALYENGFREEQDVDQMKLLEKNAENEVIKAEREIKIAKVVLKYTMGLDVEQEIGLTDQLSEHLDPVLKGKESKNFDIASHIDYRIMEIQYLGNKKLLDLEKSYFLPKISAFYNWQKTTYGNNANLFKSTQNWYPSSLIGLSVSLPIFSSGQKLSKVNQARMELDKVANQRNLMEQTLQKDYLTALANMESSIEKYGNDMENLQLAVKILDKTKIKFNNGMTSSTELAQIESQYLQSQGTYIGSILQVLQSDLNLKKAVGTF